MSKKSERLAAISELIEAENISSQEDLLSRLREMGIEATQSTLSRDIKELKAVKVPDQDNGYAYTFPKSRQPEQETRASSIITENILSIDFSSNIAVLKTKPGYANAVAVLIDNENYEQVMGTIAGDDNIFMVMREGTSRASLVEALASVHPEIGLLYRPRNSAERRTPPTKRRLLK